MRDPRQLETTIDRFRRGFWGKEPLDRPLAGVMPDAVWSPIGFLRRPFGKAYLEAADVDGSLVETEYEHAFRNRAVFSDDLIPFAAAWRGVPWLEAMCGCPVRYATGSMAPEPCAASAAGLLATGLPGRTEWLDRLSERTAALAAGAPEDCWISTTILRGAPDVLAAMRGLSEFFLDLRDHPEPLSAAAARINALHARVLEMHFAAVPPKRGGYAHIFGYWAPGPTTVLQADVMGMCSPAMYRDLFFPHDADLVRRIGPWALFHLHSTGMKHYRHVLDLPGLAGLEVTLEANGPPPPALLPAFREILERSRLILMVDGYFEEARAMLRELPKEGLYVLVSSKFVPDEAAFRDFLTA
mgnify:CR=1 FL=1